MKSGIDAIGDTIEIQSPCVPAVKLLGGSRMSHRRVVSRSAGALRSGRAGNSKRNCRNPEIRSIAANIMRANKVTNLNDAGYRNAVGGFERLTNYRFM